MLANGLEVTTPLAAVLMAAITALWVWGQKKESTIRKMLEDHRQELIAARADAEARIKTKADMYTKNLLAVADEFKIEVREFQRRCEICREKNVQTLQEQAIKHEETMERRTQQLIASLREIAELPIDDD